MLDCKLECVPGTVNHNYRTGKIFDTFSSVTAKRLHTFSCTSAMPTRKALQTEKNYGLCNYAVGTSKVTITHENKLL